MATTEWDILQDFRLVMRAIHSIRLQINDDEAMFGRFGRSIGKTTAQCSSRWRLLQPTCHECDTALKKEDV